MSEKYHLPRLITNDLYFAAFLLCQGAELHGIVHNERRRLSFVFSGEHVHQWRQEYECGTVRLNMRSFKTHLIEVRRKMDQEQRSAPCPRNRALLPTGSLIGY